MVILEDDKKVIVAEKIKKIVSEIFQKDQKEISEETKFISDLHAKSLDIMALLAALEGEFKIKIPSCEIQGDKTIGNLISYVVRL
jgi:acyl carrier protein